MSGALDLLKVALKARGVTGTINPVAEELCTIIDHFNDLHWHDRNRYHERLRRLEKDEA